jgi:hypothetical protein
MLQSQGLGLSLPSWLTTAISSEVNALVKGKQLSIKTPTGTLSFDLSDPTQWATIAQMLSTVKVTSGPAAPAPASRVPASPIDAIPGGWLTLGLLGIGIVMFMRRR